MVCKKQHVAKSMTSQLMEFLARSGDPNQAPEALEVEIIEEKQDRQKQDKKALRGQEKQDNKHDVRKLLARKSTRATPSSSILDIQKFEDQGDALAPTEQSEKKEKVQRQVEVDRPTLTKVKGKGKGISKY